MHKVHFFLSLFLIVATFNGVFPELVRTKCSLARELFFRGVPTEDIGDWLCIAYHSSNYTGNKVGPLQEDGTRWYGVFQVSNQHWCKSPFRDSTNFCKMDCEEMLANDFGKTLECARQIQKSSGFNAWGKWVAKKCNEEKDKPTYDECFRKQKVCVDIKIGSDVL